MSRPTYNSQQIMVRRNWLGFPVLMVRFARPAYYGTDWEWGPWRRASDTAVLSVNIMLKTIWK
ncbi:MAG: hypothetical protein LPK02_07535 [Rhodobacterales bacterium]|nr:hypothetical protein [Rhodobacterales bacterium]